MKYIENPEQPYPFNEHELPYTRMTYQEAEMCRNTAMSMDKDDLLDAFEVLLHKSTNIEDVAWLISAASVGEQSYDNADRNLSIATEEHPVDVFAYGVCFGLWSGCPDLSQDSSIYITDEMNASMTHIDHDNPVQGLFQYAQVCLDFVYDNDALYFRLANDISDKFYDQQSRTPFLYGAAAGRMLYAFRQADIKSEINEAWNQHNQCGVILPNSNPWLN